MTNHPDFFVDADRSKHFCRPIDSAYKRLIEWLRSDGYLVVCPSLINEYHKAEQATTAPTALLMLVGHLQRHGRLKRFGKKALGAFRIKKHITRRLRSNPKDRDHLKIVLLSDRKLGISGDVNFCHDVNNYPGHLAIVRPHPSQVPYSSPEDTKSKV